MVQKTRPESWRWTHRGASDAGGMGPSATLIYKRLQCPAYVYTGMFITSAQGVSLIWTIVACERGVTGVREAVVTATLMEAGTLTLDGYERWWAQDPYDPAYQGVDRSVLRFLSDDECHDQQFPRHPLSKVRRVLSDLPETCNSIHRDLEASHVAAGVPETKK